IECHVPCVISTDLEERVAVGGRLDRCFDGEVATSAGPVLNYELLAEALRQPLADQAGIQVRHTPRRKSNDQAHPSPGIGLCPRDPRQGGESGRARGQMQKLSAGKFHSITSSARASTLAGSSRPSAFAVLRLTTSSYLVGACTGKSAGFSPLRMRST